MTITEKEIVKFFHRKRIETSGFGSVECLGYMDKDSQLLRFKPIIDSIDPSIQSVLDVGCGYGDIVPLLLDENAHIKYLGVDNMPAFIERAMEENAVSNNVYFSLGDFSKTSFPQFDLVVACGVFNYKTEDSGYLEMTIRRLYNTADKCFVFNMLDEDKFESENPYLTGHNKKGVLRFCRMICPQVELVEGYLEGDFTIRMKKAKAFSFTGINEN